MRSKLLLCLAVLALVGTAFAQDDDTFEIDNALDLLANLRDDAAQNFLDLDRNWNQAKENLDAQTESISKSIQVKEAECSALDDDVTKTKEEIEDTKKFIEWLVPSIQEKKDKLQELLLRRCEVNKSFINGLKRDKIALSLLEFIKTAIENKQSFTLAQQAEFNRHLASFLAAFHSNDISFLIQLKNEVIDASVYEVDVDFTTQARSDEEIGTGHVDNDKEELDLADFANGRRKNWQLYKEELIQILEDLKAKIQQKMKDAIDDEINASIALANYKNTILKEIETFEKQLVKEQANLVALENLLVKQQSTADECKSQLISLKYQAHSIEEEYKKKAEEYDEKSKALKEEIDLFTEIIEEYKNTVYNTDDEFKARQDDYIDDGTFDNGEYDEREVPKIETLESQQQG